MTSLQTRMLITLAPLVYFFVSNTVLPTVEVMGLFSTPTNLNNADCEVVKGLEACEDAWIHQQSNLAYLPCSTIPSRLNWTPAALHLNESALPSLPPDQLVLLDLTTLSYNPIELTDLPPSFPGIFTHAIDVFQHPPSASSSPDAEKLTILLNSHRPQLGAAVEGRGARSVVEVFETVLGSREAKWVRTVEDPLLRTPNNLVAMGDDKGRLKGFYVSNDHRRKVHWTRKWESIYAEPSDIIYCSFEDSSPDGVTCQLAFDGLKYPNGLALGSDSQGNRQLYAASSGGEGISVFAINPDDTLRRVDRVPIARIIDNIYVDPHTGTVLAVAFPDVMELFRAFAGKGASPTEVWAVKNSTATPGGKNYSFERVYADTSASSSITTASAPWGENKLLLTGIMTPEAKVCKTSW